jgi:hypothetical protein
MRLITILNRIEYYKGILKMKILMTVIALGFGIIGFSQIASAAADGHVAYHAIAQHNHKVIKKNNNKINHQAVKEEDRTDGNK